MECNSFVPADNVGSTTNKKIPGPDNDPGMPFFPRIFFGVLSGATGSTSNQAGLLTPGSVYLLRLPNGDRQ